MIQKYEPMNADMTAGFKVVDNKIVLDRIDLVTDGAVSRMTGVVDLRNWPEQTYQIKSKVQFPKQREIFFARDKFTLSGKATSPAPSTCSRAGASSRATSRARWPASTTIVFPISRVRSSGCGIEWK